MKAFLKHIKDTRAGPIDVVRDTDILNYKSSLRPDTAWYVSDLRPFLRKWYALQLPGVSQEVIRLFEHMKIPTNTIGKAVLTNDPYDGALSDMEFEGLINAEKRSYLAGDTTLDDHLKARLSIHFAPRPAQISLLKIRDFEVETLASGQKVYFIRIPRIKQGGPARAQFKRRPLIPTLGALFELHTENLREQFSLEFDDPGDVPLFPSPSGKSSTILKLHSTSRAIGKSITTVWDKLTVYSERTGEPLHITETRMRRTRGSRLFDEGYGEAIIADELDHSTVDHVRVYAEARPKLVERIDAATAATLAPLARAFLGKIIATEKEATNMTDPRSRINDPRFDGVQGSCGSNGSCGFNKPIACYTCPSFEAWRDGPHAKVLQSLIEHQNDLLSKGCERLAKNLERTIVACTELVRRIKK